jgi:hypothetical protein
MTTKAQSTLDELVQEIAGSGDFRTTFIVTGHGVGGHPYAKRAGGVALGAVNMARRLRAQDGWSDIQILKWNDDSGVYEDARALDKNGKEFRYVDQAFPPAKTDSKENASDLATRRVRKNAIGDFIVVLEQARQNEAFGIEARAYLADQFLEMYTAIGGDAGELVDNLAE